MQNSASQSHDYLNSVNYYQNLVIQEIIQDDQIPLLEKSPIILKLCNNTTGNLFHSIQNKMMLFEWILLYNLHNKKHPPQYQLTQLLLNEQIQADTMHDYINQHSILHHAILNPWPLRAKYDIISALIKLGACLKMKTEIILYI